MKSKISLPSRRQATTVVVGLMLVSSSFVYAQDATEPAAAPVVDPYYPAGRTVDPETTREVAPEGAKNCDELIGQNVLGKNGETLGAILDLIVERESGKIEYALVSTGGFIGIGDTVRAIPFSALEAQPRVDDDDTDFILNIDKAHFQMAPKFANTPAALHALHPDRHGQQILDFYSAAESGQASEEIEALSNAEAMESDEAVFATEAAGRYARVSELQGRTVRNGDEDIGEIEKVVANADHDTVIAVVEPDMNFAGTTNRVAIPLGRLSATVEGGELTANLTREDFSKAEPANESDPFSGDQPVYQWEVQDSAARAGDLDLGSVDDPARTQERPSAIGS